MCAQQHDKCGRCLCNVIDVHNEMVEVFLRHGDNKYVSISLTVLAHKILGCVHWHCYAAVSTEISATVLSCVHSPAGHVHSGQGCLAIVRSLCPRPCGPCPHSVLGRVYSTAGRVHRTAARAVLPCPPGVRGPVDRVHSVLGRVYNPHKIFPRKRGIN